MLAEQPTEESKARKPDSLTRSFIVILIAYQLIQCGIFIGYSVPLGFFASYALVFSISSIGFHVLVYSMLILFKGDFTLEPSGIRLDRINRANMITLFRLSTLPTIFFIVLASKDYPMRYELIALVAIIFATDFLDGYVSRRDKETTRVGKMMDSASDYLLLFVISIVFYYFHIIPAWFMILFIFRLAAQVAMILTVLAVKKRLTPRTSFAGKAAVASTMILYAFELLRFVLDIHPAVYTVLEYIAGGIVILSVIDKVMLMKSDLRSPSLGSKQDGRLNSVVHGEKHGTD